MNDNNRIQNHIDRRNGVRLAQWRERWFLQGGTHLFPAHPLQDLRNDEDRSRHMCIRFCLHVARRDLAQSKPSVKLATIVHKSANVIRLERYR